jgi:GNAT superfamily N-acetyltransferase
VVSPVGSIMGIMDLTISPLTADLWPALEDLFGRAGASNGCWCMFWRLGPGYHDRPREQNKAALRELAGRPGHPPGLVALDGDLAGGWCEVAPRAELGWLERARHLGPVDDLPVWSVPCFYVRRTYRGRDVTGALIDAAVEMAAALGAPAVEAYPVDTAVPAHTGNLYTGIASVFTGHGFQVVARRKPDRPVMRKATSCASSGLAFLAHRLARGTGAVARVWPARNVSAAA